MALTRDKMLAAIAAGGKLPIYKSSVINMAAGHICSLWRATGALKFTFQGVMTLTPQP
jgi:hypothetical protein